MGGGPFLILISDLVSASLCNYAVQTSVGLEVQDTLYKQQSGARESKMNDETRHMWCLDGNALY